MATPTPVFPGAIATDANLMVANNLIRTTLTVPVTATNTILFVTSTAGFVANSLVSIDNEIISIASVVASPNPQLIVASNGRGFDGTQAAVHAAGARVSMFIDAWHHNVLATEIKAIEGYLGPQGQNIGTGYPFLVAATFNYPVQSPGGILVPGNNVITLAPVPKGVNGSDTGHYLYISGGTGTAEAVLITGGTAVSGQPSGTVIVNCANAHSGAWTIASATGGLQEAVNYASAGTRILIAASITLYANVVSGGKHITVEKFPNAAITNAGTYSIFGCRNNYGVTANNEIIDTDGVLIAGLSNTATTIIGSAQPPTPLCIYRATNVNEDPAQGQNAVYIQEDFWGAQGTPGGLRANVFAPNCTNSYGATGIAGYCYLGWSGSGSGTIGFGVHGQCDVYQGVPGKNNVGVGLNAEGSLLQTSPAGPMPYITGVVSNVGTGNVSDAIMNGIDIHSNPNPSGNNIGGGITMHADTSGTHLYGIRISDNGGVYTYPVIVNTAQTNSPTFAICNTTPGTGSATSSIGFYRGQIDSAHLLGEITVSNTTDFGTGVLKIFMGNAGAVNQVMMIDSAQQVTLSKSVRTTPIPVAQLPPGAGNVGSWACVNDATSTTTGTLVVGGGTNTVAVFCTPAGWKIVMS